MKEIDFSVPVHERDFSWALRAMKNGHAVGRAMWREIPPTMTTYTSVRLEDQEGRHPDLIATLNDGTVCQFTLTGHMLLAEDWELV